MRARELFEKLGYEYYEGSYSIEYLKPSEDLFETIKFDKEDKTFYKQTKYEAGDITLEELQAINKQIEELGWND